MKTGCSAVSFGLYLASWLLVSPAVSNAVVLPYTDTFNVPPYTNNTAIAGQQGWLSLSAGGSPYAVITNDFTGSGRGTSLYIGSRGDGTNSYVYQTIAAPFNTQDLRVTYNIYGDLESSSQTMPYIRIGDEVQGYYAVSLEGLSAATPYKFRANVNNSYLVPGINCHQGTWYTVTINVFWNAKTYNVKITDGVSTGILNNIPFWYDSSGYHVSALNHISFIHGHNGTLLNGSGLIDNLIIMQLHSGTIVSFH